jgi:hypothetical protein
VIAESGLTVVGATVALPGVVGPDGGLQRAPNLPLWIDVPVGTELSVRLDGLPVDTGNEADLAALAELWCGGGRPDKLYVSGEIGVGGAIMRWLRKLRWAGRSGWHSPAPSTCWTCRPWSWAGCTHASARPCATPRRPSWGRGC